MRADQMNQHRTMDMTHDAFDASLAMRAICLVPFPESEGSKQYDPMRGSFRSVNEPLSSASIEEKSAKSKSRAKSE